MPANNLPTSPGDKLGNDFINSKKNILINAFRSRNNNTNVKRLNNFLKNNPIYLNFKLKNLNAAVNRVKNAMDFESGAGNIREAEIVSNNGLDPIPVAGPATVALASKKIKSSLKIPVQVTIANAKEQIAKSEGDRGRQLLSGLLKNMNAGIGMALTSNDRKYLEDYRKFIQTTENSKIFASMFNRAWNPTENQLNVMRNIMNKRLNKFLTPGQLKVVQDKLREKNNIGARINAAVELLKTGDKKNRTIGIANLRGISGSIPPDKQKFMALFNAYNRTFRNPANIRRFASSNNKNKYIKNYGIFMTNTQRKIFAMS